MRGCNWQVRLCISGYMQIYRRKMKEASGRARLGNELSGGVCEMFKRSVGRGTGKIIDVMVCGIRKGNPWWTAETEVLGR